MTRRTTEQTRQLLLDVGIQLLHERGVHVGVSHIKLSDVVAAADLTTGAAYRCWDSQEEFHCDLAAAAVRQCTEPPNPETLARIIALVEARAPLAEVISVAAEANLSRYPEDTASLTTIALRACGPTVETLAEAGRDRLATAVQRFGSMYDALLGAYELRMRAPFTIAQMTLTLIALTEGFALQAMSGAPHPRLQRSDMPPLVDADWTVFACAIEAVFRYFTEPDPDTVQSSCGRPSPNAEDK